MPVCAAGQGSAESGKDGFSKVLRNLRGSSYGLRFRAYYGLLMKDLCCFCVFFPVVSWLIRTLQSFRRVLKSFATFYEGRTDFQNLEESKAVEVLLLKHSCLDVIAIWMP